MTSVIRKEASADGRQKAQDSSTTSDVQLYLISNYREALKKGDRSAAKSCLLAARYFSVNDPNVTNEIYLMAKSDGDVGEASKCFANMFSDLFLDNAERDSSSSPEKISSELQSVIHQIKDETRSLLTDLKSQYLRLKSLPAPAALASRQTSSIQTSPMLSPRMRMSSEDRTTNRESVAKLDLHLHSSSRSMFYQQLFDSLPETIKKSLLDHSIETCETPIEQCRLMMLAMSIFNENVNNYGGRLLRILIGLSGSRKQQEASKIVFGSPLPSVMQQYAKSLLVLDAIPLVLGLAPLSILDIDIDALYEATLNFYSSQCLETSASEFEANELHEGVKKSIATRILGIEHNSALDEAMEEHVVMTMNLISQKYIETLTEDEEKAKLNEFYLLIKDKQNLNQKFDQILALIQDLNLDEDMPDSVLFAGSKDEQGGSQPTPSTPPPKGRGRPKKQAQQSVIVSPDDVMKKQQQSKSREAQFTFFSILQHMFMNCASYLKRTRSRIFMNFSSPLLAHLEKELAKSSSQRSSRSKAGSQPINSDILAPAAKRPRLDTLSAENPLKVDSRVDPSPLNTEQSRVIDSRLLQTLSETHKCLEFLNSNFGVFTKLWTRFLETTHVHDLKWYRRIGVDTMLFAGKYDEIPKFLEANLDKSEGDIEIKTEQSESGTSTLTINPSCRQANVSDLRNLVQLISSYIQLADKGNTLSKIDELLSRMKQCGLLTNDESYSSGNIIPEYLIIVKQDDKSELGFLFFDTLSLLRYIINILMDMLKRYLAVANLTTDTAIGHTIVLSQFDWPREAPICSQCISWLRIKKPKSTTPQCLSSATKFTYLDFFNYLLNPNIIEDFMAMLCHGYTLDIKSNSSTGFVTPTSSQIRDRGSGSSSSSRGSSSSTSRSKAITTRGVNKTFKEDLKVALTSQMRNSVVLIPLDLISDFIQNSLIPYFNA